MRAAAPHLFLVLAASAASAAGAAQQAAPMPKPAAPKPAAPKPAPPRPAVERQPAGSPGSTEKKKRPALDASVAFFRDGVVPRLKIQIPEPELQRLRQNNREYVRCTITEDDRTEYQSVGIHLKGAAGSFRGIDDRPALTLNFDKFVDDQVFHDLDKIHLNNSVQDPSYLHELVGSELFLAAGVPAARTTHARVWLNGRDLGFYVLKEGFNKRFLKRHFADADGNLYEGGFVRDLDGEVKLQNGKGPADRSDVKAVVDACREGDAARRAQRVEQVVDIDRFLTFAAMELIVGHWDGYVRNRNNYRFYFDPKTGKVQFFPHGMDQLFQDPGFNALEIGGSIVGNAVAGNPEWRARYRDRLAELVKRVVPPDPVLARIEAHRLRLRPVLAAMSPGHANEFDNRAKELKDRITARARSLAQQTTTAQEPRPLRFSPSGAAALARWEPRKETEDARLDRVEPAGGQPYLLGVAAGPGGRCVASWRTRVLLAAGRYRFEGRARAQGVKALAEASGTGAGLRVSGGARTNKLDGTAGWTALAHEFQVGAPTQEVELVAELRATAGKVEFDAGSLRLVKLQ